MRSNRPNEKKTMQVFVTRSGPRKGAPDCQAAFKTREEAIRFLSDLHGLEYEQLRALRRDGKLRLKAKVHGSDQCAISEEEMPPEMAKRALSGDLYLQQRPA